MLAPVVGKIFFLTPTNEQSMNKKHTYTNIATQSFLEVEHYIHSWILWLLSMLLCLIHVWTSCLTPNKYNSMKNSSPIFSNSNKNNNIHLICNFSASGSMLGAFMLDPVLFLEHPCDKYGHPHFWDEETEAPENLNNLPTASEQQERKLNASFPPHLPPCLSNCYS